MINKANSDSEKNKCREYLRNRGLESPTDCFLYIENENGIITAVAGITIGECDRFNVGYIEPYYADNNAYNIKLYCAVEGYLLARMVKYIIVGCEQNETTESMYVKLGYQKWSKNMNQYIKLLNTE